MSKLFKHFQRGVKKYRSGDYRGAIVDFDKEIDQYSFYPDTHVYRGSAKYHIGDQVGALKDWLKAAELGDSNAYDIIEIYFN